MVGRPSDNASYGTKARPAWLQAMGKTGPPPRVTVGDQVYALAERYKTDAFAMTCRYEPADTDESAVPQRIIVKFGRTRRVLLVPMGWLGRWLTRRERALLHAMADHPGVPEDLGPVSIDGEAWPNAGARVFFEGPTLMEARRSPEIVARIDNAFFESLDRLLEAMHQRDLAYVDLNKPDNVLVLAVGGSPDAPLVAGLIDYQIHFALPRSAPLRWLLRPVLGVFQQADRYHAAKHRMRIRPDLFPGGEDALDRLRPRSIRIFRRVWRYPMGLRRRLLVRLGVRTGKGRAETERGMTGG